MGNFCTLNSMVILIFTQITSIRSYKKIYAFSCLKSVVLMNTRDRIQQHSHKMGQNTILWIHQHYLKFKKLISFIYKSKIDHQITNDNCIINFTLSSYATLMPLYTHSNATNNKINIKYWAFYYVYKLFTLVSSVLFAQKCCIIHKLIIKNYANFRENDYFVIKLNQTNQIKSDKSNQNYINQIN
eukprot:466267_1